MSARLEVSTEVESEVELQIAAARTPGLTVEEQLTVRHDGKTLPWTEIAAPHHGRIHLVTLPAGRTTIDYHATVGGQARSEDGEPAELSAYRRPSRYATSDSFAGFAHAEFGTLDHHELLPAVSSWVGTRLAYVPGSTGPTDGAVDILLSGAGVCRDYAHLVITLLRALGIPARLAAVYAPGCDPMDFHAVVEAHVSGGWYAVDASALAPRDTLVRIATGRDAADTAFMSTVRGNVALDAYEVTALADDGLPADDVFRRVPIT